MLKKVSTLFIAAVLAISMTACTGLGSSSGSSTSSETSGSSKTSSSSKVASSVTSLSTSSDGTLKGSELFTDRDLTQSADLSNAKSYTVSDGQEIKITSEGVYVISGEAKNVTIIVDADKEDKVQLVLDVLTITNSDSPAIYVKNADKVFVTTASGSSNTLSVTGSFTSDGDTKTDAVIFSKDDLVLNGQGSLTISSSDNGITSKDDLKVTGGTLNITCESDALEANDSIAIADGDITIKTNKDALHAEKDGDDSVGYIYIGGGKLTIEATSDGIQGTTFVQIDDGEMNITASEGIEGTHVQINGGTINITASDDGINASNKSSAEKVVVEINGGDITIDMGQGDTDGVDSNGDLYINGGTISVNAQSPFDYDGTAEKNGGTIIVNGSETDTITNQMMGGGPGGGQGGSGGPGGNGDFGGRGGF